MRIALAILILLPWSPLLLARWLIVETIDALTTWLPLGQRWAARVIEETCSDKR